VLAPPLTVTASGEHTGFAGTLSIGTATTEAVVIELVRSADWAAGVVLVNWHGGNRSAVDSAAATLHAEHRDAMSWWPSTEGGDAHAGDTETSLLLALGPHRVRLDRVEAGETAPLPDLLDRLRAGGVATVSRNGVLGDPRRASPARGRELLDELTADLLASYDRWSSAR
jgi:mycofactocin precursor peptide peptidase